MSVAALAANLDAMGYFPLTHAVFGAMADKDLAPCCARLNAAASSAGISLDLPTAARGALAAALQTQWQASRRHALRQARRTQQAFARPLAGPGTPALAAADPADRIVVFGSFYTVGGVLQQGCPPGAALPASMNVDPIHGSFKFRQVTTSQAAAPVPAAEGSGCVDAQARATAWIGAAVLVVIGVSGFPMVFDQPAARRSTADIADRHRRARQGESSHDVLASCGRSLRP
jgi:hypothetical protein